MKKLLYALNTILLLPMTIPVWLFYILPLWLIARDFKLMGVDSNLTFTFKLADKDIVPFHARLWKGWAGVTLPNTICYIDFGDPAQTQRTLVHEQQHIKQLLTFGPLQPILYLGHSIYIWFFEKDKHAYYDNYFERDARKAAGQLVDIPQKYWGKDRWPWW